MSKTQAKKSHELQWQDRVFHGILKASACGIIMLAVGMVFNLILLAASALPLSIDAFSRFSAGFSATLESSLFALLIACPLALATALFLTELSPRVLSQAFGFLIEFMASLPGVVFGFWAVSQLLPRLTLTLDLIISTSLASVLVLAVMVLPTLVAHFKSIFQNHPRAQREAVLALGGTRFEVIRFGVVAGTQFQIVSALLLALVRVMGETLAVAMVSGQTLASLLISGFETDMELSQLGFLGFVLLLISVLVSALSRWIDRKFAKAVSGAKPGVMPGVMPGVRQ